MLILPRQARDKHRENSKTDRFLSAADQRRAMGSRLLSSRAAEAAAAAAGAEGGAGAAASSGGSPSVLRGGV